MHITIKQSVIMTKRFLFLDDDPRRHNAFSKMCQEFGVTACMVSTVTQAISALNTWSFDCIFLDHDLDITDPEETGQAVAEFIALHLAFDWRPSAVVIHSHNPEGAIRMEQILQDGNFHNVKRLPFSPGTFA
jgi:CheY-like chemotaxis protein